MIASDVLHLIPFSFCHITEFRIVCGLLQLECSANSEWLFGVLASPNQPIAFLRRGLSAWNMASAGRQRSTFAGRPSQLVAQSSSSS